MNFSAHIIQWYKLHQRNLPWRQTKDPYRIWLSEIMLQQTRVAQGLPYYTSFVKHFPRVCDLAAASQDQVLKLWQGLGYYSRARNLHYTAQDICYHKNGVFPDNYKDLIKLKGVGEYTAAAIASFSFNEAVAVLDGNVFRVLSRFLGIEAPINSTEGKKIFKAKADELLDPKNPATYNQAIMEFGALHCTPKQPNCLTCSLKTDCVAYQTGKVNELPIKLKKTKIKNKYFDYLVVKKNDRFIIEQRQGKGIWENLFQFPVLESDHKKTRKEVELQVENLFSEESFQLKKWNSKPIKHVLSHRKIWATFWLLEIDFHRLQTNEEWHLVKLEKITDYAVPVLIEKFIEDYFFSG
ncbi:MAG: A/G-specific adenine glycosylase [Bacteroidota bacterium]